MVRKLTGSLTIGPMSAGLLCFLTATAVAQEDLDHLKATRDRPLFTPTRRRPPPPPVAASGPVARLTPAQTPPPSLQLNGVIVGPDRTFAIVKRTSDAKLVSLEVGLDIDGWLVAAIRPREVDLRKESRTVTIRLPTR